MTVKLTLRRLTFSPDSPTLGVLLQGNKPLCVTVERPWMGNARNVSWNILKKLFINIFILKEIQRYLTHRRNSIYE